MEWKTYNTKEIRSKHLYKFISEANLLKFLETGNIWFSRSDKFGDKMECVGINDLIKDRPNFRKIEDRKKRHLISCFHVGNKETLAFWDTFSDSESNRRKYAIRFNREYFVKLVESTKIADTLIPKIEKIVHGKVKYKNLINVEKTELSKKKVKYLAFRKEFVFAYES